MRTHDLTTLDDLRQAIGDWAELFDQPPMTIVEYLLTCMARNPQGQRYAIDDLYGRLTWIVPTVTLLDFPALWINEAWCTCRHETLDCAHVRIEAALHAVMAA